MNITEIKIRRVFRGTKIKAFVSIIVDSNLAIHDIKVIEGSERLFVAMPSRKDDNDVFRDIVHPMTSEARSHIEQLILLAYQDFIDNSKHIAG